jgi:hypothetical protein
MKVMDSKSNRIEFIDTRYLYDYKYYLEWCEDNDVEPAPDDSDEFYNWCYREQEFDVECFFDNLNYSSKNPVVCLTGDLGLWYGRRDIVPMMFESEKINGKPTSAITKAVKSCINGCDYFMVALENGVLEVNGYHHDGCNTFYIRGLNSVGIAGFNDAEEAYEDPEPNESWFKDIEEWE